MNNCGRRSLIRKPICSVLINGLCLFEDGTRAATAASKSSVGLDVKYENAWRFVAQLPRRRSGIIREMALVMSRPSVVPRYAVTVGSLLGGTVIGKTPEERGKLHLGFQTLTLCRAENL